MRLLRWKKRVIITLVAVTLAISYIILRIADDITCSNSLSVQVLDHLCEDYHRGLLAGSLCDDLCDQKSIDFLKCTNYKDGKAVYFAKWQQRIIVWKSKESHWYDFGSTDNIFNELTPFEFRSMIITALSFMLEFDINRFPKLNQRNFNLLSEVWSLNFATYTEIKAMSAIGNKEKLQASMRSLWTLAQQEEYLLLMFLRNQPHVPDVLGTCGHFYAMEYLPTKSLRPHLLDLTTDLKPWKQRAAVTIGLLDALKSYEVDFHETLHLCDVKGENFGINNLGEVKIIDLDNTFFTSRLKKVLQASSCSGHEDCDFFDCRGLCDMSRQKCTKQRTNNNLQVVCQKIFRADISNMFLGLLRAPPPSIKDKIISQLETCARMGENRKPVNSSVQAVLLDAIYALL